MMAQNMTKFTLTIVLLGVFLAIAVFRPQILPPEVKGLTDPQAETEEPTSPPSSERPEGSSPPPADQAPSAQDSIADQKLRLAQEWAKLTEEKTRLVKAREALRIEKEQVAQDKRALQDERARLAEAWKSLEAERATLDGLKQDLEAERVRLAEQESGLRTLKAALSEQEQRVRALQKLSLAVLSLGSLTVVSLILLVAIAMWKDKRVTGNEVDPTKMPKSTRQKRQAYPQTRISSTCGPNGGGNNGRDKKEVIRTP